MSPKPPAYEYFDYRKIRGILVIQLRDVSPTDELGTSQPFQWDEIQEHSRRENSFRMQFRQDLIEIVECIEPKMAILDFASLTFIENHLLFSSAMNSIYFQLMYKSSRLHPCQWRLCRLIAPMKKYFQRKRQAYENCPFVKVHNSLDEAISAFVKTFPSE